MTDKTDGTPGLRCFDDDTLLDMYDHAYEIGDEHCDVIAELLPVSWTPG